MAPLILCNPLRYVRVWGVRTTIYVFCKEKTQKYSQTVNTLNRKAPTK